MIRLAITFDVTSRKSYKSITKLLKTYGFRVQKSVYEIQIYKKDVDKLSQLISNMIDDKLDSVIIYNLGKDNNDNIIRKGKINNTGIKLMNDYYIII